MGVSIEVDTSNFNLEVAQASFQKPVIVDFFAQWCGPCQMLKPMLEKLVQEYDFILAKIDIDRSPDIANACGVQGVPDVRLVSQGKMYAGFVGVLPEPQLREWLNQLNLQFATEKDVAELEAAQQAAASGEVEAANQLFRQLMNTYPENRKVLIEAARFWIGQDQLGEAEMALVPIEEQDRTYAAQAEALRNLIQLKVESQQTSGHPLDEPFTQAVTQTAGGDYEAALQGFLAIVSQDRKYRSDSARKGMLVIFSLLGDGHPLTQHYRKQLMQVMY